MRKRKIIVNGKTFWAFGKKLRTVKNRCFYCNKSIDELTKTIDHVIPKQQGGILSRDNKVYSCVDCNQLKSNRNPEEFLGMINAMIRFEKNSHESKIGYLKKIKMNLNKMLS